ETRRHDTDDQRRTEVERDRAADDGRIATEAALPEFVTEDGDGVGARRLFARQEVPAKQWPRAEDVEELARHFGGVDAIGVSRAVECDVAVSEGSEALEGLRLVAIKSEECLREPDLDKTTLR